MSAFEKFVHKLENGKEHYSPNVARKIAAKVGDEKYGKHGMAEKAAAARKHKESKSAACPLKMARREDGSYECPSTWEGTFREQMKNLRYGPDSDKPARKLPHTAEMTEDE